MVRNAPKHANWISAPSRGYDPLRGSYVGVSAKGAAELGKQGIVLTDDVVKTLNIPVMSSALELMDDIFSVADTLGVGTEVRAGVYAIRGATYVGSTVSAALGIPIGSGAMAMTGVFAGIGGAAAFGAIAVVVAIGFVLFGGPSDEEEAAAEARQKKAQVAIRHLKDRLTLAQFAAEQDAAAMAASFGGAGSSTKAGVTAQKLAAFYRTVDKTLPKPKRALFESLSNLARWQGALVQYERLSQSEKDSFDVIGFGHSEPRLPYQISIPMKAETAKLGGLVAAAGGGASGSEAGGGASGSEPGLGTIALLIAAASAGIYAAYSPSGAAALARGAASKVTGAARAAVAKVRRATP